MYTIDPPIQRLPADLLTAFFLQCLPCLSRDHPGSQLSPNHPSIILSQVCHRWRELALHTPSLWSRMYISVDSPGSSALEWCMKVERLRDVVKTWIGRSRECPLVIWLDVPDITSYYSGPGALATRLSDAYRHLLREISQCSKRWREFNVDLCSSTLTAPPFLVAFQWTAEAVPNLESFAMRVDASGLHRAHTASFYRQMLMAGFLSGHGTSLRRVKLDQPWDLDLLVTTGVARWARLTELEIKFATAEHGHFNASHALQLMAACPKLVKVSFVLFCERPGQDIQRTPPVTLFHLRSLSLGGVQPGPEFARSLLLPSLSTCSLVFQAPADPHYIPPDRLGKVVGSEGVIEFVRKFGLQLTAVALNPGVLPQSSLPDILEWLNHDRLERLSLVHSDFPTVPSGIRTIFAPDSKGRHAYTTLLYLAKPSAFPSLKHLEMNAFNNEINIGGGECEAALIEMIAARRRKVAGSAEGSKTVAGEEGSQVENVPSHLLEDHLPTSEPTIRTSIMDVHITFSQTTKVKIIEELDGRGVDLDAEPFNIRLNYPDTSESLGEVPTRIWE